MKQLVPKLWSFQSKVDNSGATNTGATNTGATNTGTTNIGATNTGAANTGAVNPGATNTGASNIGATSTGTTNIGATNTGANSTGAANPGATNTGASNIGATSTGTTNIGATNTGANSTGAANPHNPTMKNTGNINPSVLDNAFQKSSNTQTAADRSCMLRERFYWNTPRIYADPSKPTMPIHAAPLETVIRTGRFMPGVVIGMRTPTEVARLEKEVHSLRSQLLDRTWQCPYAECHAGPFKVNDPAAIDQHMRIEHSTLKCFLCDDVNNLMPYYDQKSIREHFVTHHAAEFTDLSSPFGAFDTFKKQNLQHIQDLQNLLSVNALDTINKNKMMLFNYCDRCGRDQFRLDHPADRLHHDKVCREVSADAAQKKIFRMPLCKFCGSSRTKMPESFQPEPCSCQQVPRDPFDPGSVCPTCGIKYDGHSPPMDRHYREIHERWCAKHSGGMWDWCGFCGVGLQGRRDLARRLHVHWCEERPNKGPATCPFPSCTESLFNGAQAKTHIETAHGNNQTCPFCRDTFTDLTPDEQQMHLALHLYNIGAAPPDLAPLPLRQLGILPVVQPVEPSVEPSVEPAVEPSVEPSVEQSPAQPDTQVLVIHLSPLHPPTHCRRTQRKGKLIKGLKEKMPSRKPLLTMTTETPTNLIAPPMALRAMHRKEIVNIINEPRPPNGARATPATFPRLARAARGASGLRVTTQPG